MKREKFPVEIRLLAPEDEPALMEYYKSNLEPWEKFQHFWRWRRQASEVSGGQSAAVAKENNQIVGAVGIVPVDVRVKGELIRSCWQQDSLVCASMRGKGVGKRLVEAGGNGWHMVMAKGTSKAMYGLRKKAGFLDVPNSDYLLRVCRPTAKNKNFKKIATEYGLGVWKSILPKPGEVAGMSLRPVEEFNSAFETLAENLAGANVVRPYKSREYLNWRYVRCPGKRYRVIEGTKDGKVGAVVVSVLERTWSVKAG